MDQVDLLFVLVQIGGAAAGFASLATVGGAGNALARIFLEQWITFPRLVVTGEWWRTVRGAQ